jgi:hypothetical protein
MKSKLRTTPSLNDKEWKASPWSFFTGATVLVMWGIIALFGGDGTSILGVLPLYIVPVLILAMAHFVAWQLYTYN